MARSLYEATPEAAARIVARHLGIVGKSGGWLYRPSGAVECQGYREFARRLGPVIAPREVTDPRTGAKVTRYAIAWARLRGA